MATNLDKFTVEIVTAYGEHGEKTWGIATRQPLPGERRKMDYGAAEGIGLDDAFNTYRSLCQHSEVRLVQATEADYFAQAD